MGQNHILTGWKYAGAWKYDGKRVLSAKYSFLSPTDVWVVTVPHPNGDWEAIFCHTEQLARFIVRACNAHDALLEAVRLDVVDGECFCHAGPESAGRHALGLGPGPCDYCVAKQAIALAEGGEV